MYLTLTTPMRITALGQKPSPKDHYHQVLLGILAECLAKLVGITQVIQGATGILFGVIKLAKAELQ